MTKHYLSLREKLGVIYMSISRHLRLWMRFKVSFLFTVISMVVTITMFFFLGKILGGSTASPIEGYGRGEYFPYVLIGLAFQFFVLLTIRDYLVIIRKAYWSNWLEVILMSPMRLKTYFLSVMSWNYLFSTVNIALYLVIGTYVFGAGLTFPEGWYIVVLLLFLCMLSLTGIGLISGSMFLLLNAKGGVEPIGWVFTTLSGLVVGVYYPPELLPSPLQLLSKIFPHTYGLEGIRLVMQNGETLGSPNIIWIIGVLVIFSIILLPLGIALFRAGIRKAERDGTLARWV